VGFSIFIQEKNLVFGQSGNTFHGQYFKDKGQSDAETSRENDLSQWEQDRLKEVEKILSPLNGNPGKVMQSLIEMEASLFGEGKTDIHLYSFLSPGSTSFDLNIQPWQKTVRGSIDSEFDSNNASIFGSLASSWKKSKETNRYNVSGEIASPSPSAVGQGDATSAGNAASIPSENFLQAVPDDALAAEVDKNFHGKIDGIFSPIEDSVFANDCNSIGQTTTNTGQDINRSSSVISDCDQNESERIRLELEEINFKSLFEPLVENSERFTSSARFLGNVLSSFFRSDASPLSSFSTSMKKLAQKPKR